MFGLLWKRLREEIRDGSNGCKIGEMKERRRSRAQQIEENEEREGIQITEQNRALSRRQRRLEILQITYLDRIFRNIKLR